MKANSTFKLSKQAKRSLALGQWKDKDQRDCMEASNGASRTSSRSTV
jgi:hypothetical protein